MTALDTRTPVRGGAAPGTVRTVRAARLRSARRTRLVLAVLGLLLLGVVAARVLLGDFTVTVADFVRILLGADIPGASYIVMENKLPRAVLAVLVGVCFGLGGAVFQTALRNPLASPDLVGVSLGASAAAVLALVVLDLSGTAVSVAAVVGAGVVALVVRVTAGPAPGHRLVLVGVGCSAGLVSVIHHVLTRADVWDAQLVLRWLTGSVGAASWGGIRLLALTLVVLLPLLAWLARTVRPTELGAEAATGLGVPPRRTEALLLVAVVLVAVAVAAAGPVAFIAFMAGPIARAANRGRTTLVGAALVGAALVVGADYLADYGGGSVGYDVNLPVGVVTGAFGAPFLLWLLASGRTGSRS